MGVFLLRRQYQFRLGASGLLSQRNRKQFRFVGGGGGRMGGGGVKGIVPFYNVIRKFVLCKERTKCENHFNFEK